MEGGPGGGQSETADLIRGRSGSVWWQRRGIGRGGAITHHWMDRGRTGLERGVHGAHVASPESAGLGPLALTWPRQRKADPATLKPQQSGSAAGGHTSGNRGIDQLTCSPAHSWLDRARSAVASDSLLDSLNLQ